MIADLFCFSIIAGEARKREYFTLALILLNKYYMKNQVRENENYFAKLIAAVVHNKMEDFHCEHLSDAQMKELNKII